MEVSDIFSAKRERDMSIYINDTGEFVKGVYTLEVYTQQSLLGRAECMLR